MKHLLLLIILVGSSVFLSAQCNFSSDCIATDETCEGLGDGTVTAGTCVDCVRYSIDGGITWQMSNVFLDLMSGDYTVLGEDIDGERCECNDVTVNSGPTPIAPSFSFTMEYCEGADVDVLPDISDNGIEGVWSPTVIDDSNSDTYTFVPNSGQCAEEITFDVEIFENPLPEISGSLSFCSGGSTLLSVNSIFDQYFWSNGDATQSITVISSGTYVVTVTDNNGCTGTDEEVVSENDSLMPEITGDNTFCTGGNTLLSVSSIFDQYSWSNGGTTQSITVMASGTYTVTVTDNNGCTGTDDFNVSVSQSLMPEITGSPTFCSGESSMLSVSSMFDQYSWSNGGATQSITVMASGTYTVTVTDNNGCTGTDQFDVSQSPPLTPIISGNNAFCSGENTLLSVSSAFDVYSWSNGASTQSITVTSPGPYTVIVTDVSGCSGNSMVQVIENPLPTLETIPIGESCEGENDGMISFVNSGGASSYTTSLTGPTTGMSQAASGTFDDLIPGTYTLSVIDANGCPTNGIVSIPSATEVSVSIGGINGTQQDLCDEATPITLTASGASNYSWIINGNPQGNSNSIMIGDNEGPGTYNISLMGTMMSMNQPNETCSDPTPPSVTVNIRDNPQPIMTLPQEICQDSEGEARVSQIIDTDLGDFHDYKWNTQETSSSIDIATNNPSDFVDYSVTVTDSYGCEGDTSGEVYVNAAPSSSFDIESSVDELFVGIVFDIFGMEEPLESDATIMNSTWCFSPSIIDGLTGEMYPTLSGANHIGLITNINGPHEFTYKVLDSNGCTNETSKYPNFGIFGNCRLELTMPDVLIFCQDTQESFKFQYTPSTPTETVDFNLDFITYSIVDGMGNPKPDAADISVTGNTDDNPDITFNEPGDISIRATLNETNSSLGGCRDTFFDFPVKVRATPSIMSFNGDPQLGEICDTVNTFITLSNIEPSNEDLVIEITLNDGINNDIPVKDTIRGPDIAINILDLWKEGAGEFAKQHTFKIDGISYSSNPACFIDILDSPEYSFSILDCGCSGPLEPLEDSEGDFSDDMPRSICNNEASLNIEFLPNSSENDAIEVDDYFILSVYDNIGNQEDQIANFIDGETTIELSNSTIDSSDFLKLLSPDGFGDLYLYRVRTLQDQSLQTPCSQLTNPVKITVEQSPEFSLQSDKDDYCLNEPAAKIFPVISNKQDVTVFESLTYLEGMLPSIRPYVNDTILVGLNESIFTADNDYVFEGTVEFQFEDGLKCLNSEVITLSINDGISINGEDEFIQWWQGNILACSLNDEDIYSYQWYTDSGNEIPDSDNWYIIANEVDFNDDGIPMSNGSLINYWVDVWGPETVGDCPLTLYYTGDGFAPRASNQDSELEFLIYPNPNNGLFQIELLKDFEFIDEITVVDVLGNSKLSLPFKNESNLLEVNLENLSSGLYVCTIRYRNGRVISQKFIID